MRSGREGGGEGRKGSEEWEGGREVGWVGIDRKS